MPEWMKAWHGGRRQKLATHIFIHPQEAESETRKWGGTINTQRAPLVIISDTQDLENLPLPSVFGSTGV